MVAKYSVLALALALTASALQITRPSNETGWSTDGANLIEWDSVSTDPSNFTIQLINPSNPNDPITIAENVQSSDHTYTYSPSSALTAADQYRVNFVSQGAGILAQSNYFEVEQGASSVSASSSSASATSGSASASSSASRSAASGASSVSSGASSASSAAASASQSGAASMLIAPTGLLALVAAALGVLA